MYIRIYKHEIVAISRSLLPARSRAMHYTHLKTSTNETFGGHGTRVSGIWND